MDIQVFIMVVSTIGPEWNDAARRALMACGNDYTARFKKAQGATAMDAWFVLPSGKEFMYIKQLIKETYRVEPREPDAV